MFEFITPTRIIFGKDSLKQAATISRQLGKKAFLVLGKSKPDPTKLQNYLLEGGLEVNTFHIVSEPTTRDIENALGKARATFSDLVISFGGGSVIDAGKAISGLLTNPGDIMDYLEVVGKGLPLTNPSAPFIAIPTTSGTGSEVTKNAVLSVDEQKIKVSMRSPFLFPKIAIIDPVLTLDLPPDLTAFSGMDALTQVVEPFLCNRANWLVDTFCVEGFKRAAKSLRTAVWAGNDLDAREDMSVLSLMGGLSLANAGLGAVHGFAAVLGGMFHAPHGAICARLLPFVFEGNYRAILKRDAHSKLIPRFLTISRLLIGNESSSIEDGISWFQQLSNDLNIPSLSSYGMTALHVENVVNGSKKSSSMKANPVALDDNELSNIINKAL